MQPKASNAHAFEDKNANSKKQTKKRESYPRPTSETTFNARESSISILPMPISVTSQRCLGNSSTNVFLPFEEKDESENDGNVSPSSTKSTPACSSHFSQHNLSAENCNVECKSSPKECNLKGVLFPIRLKVLEKELKEVKREFRRGLGKNLDGFHSDTREIRFMMKAQTSSDIKMSIANYQLSMMLRKSHGCDAIREQITKVSLREYELMYQFPNGKKVLTLFPHLAHFCDDRFGRPVAYVALREMHISKLMNMVSPKEYFEFELHRWEYMDAVLTSRSKKSGFLSQWVVIVDMTRFSRDNISFKGMNYLRHPHKVLNKIHKELLGPIIVINAPAVFQGLWAVAKYFVTARTRKKLTVYGKSYAKGLRSLLDAKNISKLEKAPEISKNIAVQAGTLRF
mmetsp:Transcript_18782/g.28142  ORF Transcript_18782/g.28142 Transcript_18782/m.28142 type:complete len:399 (+) Transcript_18782:114-1310(+)|eukprot:CAMPEP_0167750340 /NCGR_PEP_ID=MMETSP0110_2-20121227/5933_1 /TAXON_ID=629695 /ORGANISM="Gymnochlora sp., Strain CCMP2014" /LENGTH=398 /DNA_ID=CAMNT_0007635643 /DNA_START=107 /DNA_END=1303 /DNA_ORIENTATION=-